MRITLAALLAFVLIGCAGAPPSASPFPSPSPTPSPDPTRTPTPPPESGLYLRAWLTQALPPEATFGWLPMLTVSDGVVIDGNVAVPAIFPGPLLILPNARGLSEAGEVALVEQARELGLLDGRTNYSSDEPAPGAPTAHILLIVDGQQIELMGDPFALENCPDLTELRCLPEPATNEAFSWYWQRLSMLDSWLATELGPFSSYLPERVVLLTMLPHEGLGEDDSLAPQPVEWPLDVPLADFGVPAQDPVDARCGTLAGDDVEVLLPTLRQGNQLTRFVDSDEERALAARALVPGEPSPCADEG